MTIQQRITYLFLTLATGILLIFTSIVYFSASKNRTSEFYSLLEKEGITKANLLLDTQLDAHTLQTIYRNNRETLNEVEVAIYNSDQELIYHDAVDLDFVKETPEMLSEIARKDRIQFAMDKWQIVGLNFTHNQNNYIITAAALDAYGYTKLENLRNTILFTFLVGLAVIYILALYFSKKIMQPITAIIGEAQTISASNLDLRLRVESKDELGLLADTFNNMLERLEVSFEAQKQFVSYVAHEIRTPLAAIIAELELSLSGDKYTTREVLENVLNDSKKMARLSTTLLDFAKASYDRMDIKFKPTRVDEIVLEAYHTLQQSNPTYTVDISFAGDFESDDITISANPYLLETAFTNLIENACKYSKDRSCAISIATSNQSVVVDFKDKGMGIPEEEIGRIFTPFFRGKNEGIAEGTGIGLTLVDKIITLHTGKISVSSKLGLGTTFTIILPTLKA